MNATQKQRVIDIIGQTDDMTLATVRPDGFPQATTVSYVNDGLIVYFGTTNDAQKAQNIGTCDKVSLTINRPYSSWDEIVGVSLGGLARQVTDQAEFDKVAGLMFAKFPQMSGYEGVVPGELIIFRIDPVAISLLDYTKGFGHIENLTP
ncbi:pyridoxamine 5'-phosphate oxidase family protein [Aestuariivita sp.]|jgi:general stress protein 26|uniref:pyridoxamine 5'-phosphate oxidase family protein n=1 Tax=Aestuariivita sp. TaxID=1872407 RepID=UPI00216D7B1C|nr:pyridoxamine 5'-phosphate oxidase family protein [Aestuariivita sp.]MCE8006547.1 pyridoxamine 5'-phosphate oxidase family protein [Aestuariivita sp.]